MSRAPHPGPPTEPSPSVHRGWIFGGGFVAVAVVIVAVVLLASARAAQVKNEASARAEAVAAGVRAKVVRVKSAAVTRTIELQGEARPFYSVTLYAKVSGYVKTIKVDRGDRVRAGQVVAVIESPELDRQYDAAVAEARYLRSDAKRAEALAAPGVLAARDADRALSSAQVADAQVATLATQKGYEIIKAPFAGVITARFADPGALLQNATNAQTSALPVVTVSRPDRLRVFVYVDQRDAWAVHVGDAVDLAPPERPQLVVTGQVTRVTGELDPRSRTMLVEVDVDNKDERIVPGSFVSAKVHVGLPASVELPAEALSIRKGKAFVVVVTPEGRAAVRPVVVAHHDGAMITLSSGVKEGDAVALNLDVGVNDGDRIVAIFEESARAPAPHP